MRDWEAVKQRLYDDSPYREPYLKDLDDEWRFSVDEFIRGMIEKEKTNG